MYARALVFMCASRMSRARNLSASHTHSLVKLHVSCTVGVKGSNDLASLVHSLCKCIKVEVSHVRREKGQRRLISIVGGLIDNLVKSICT